MFFLKILKNISKEKKYIINKTNEAKEKMILFAEGKMSTYEFWDLYQNDECLRNILKNDRKLPKEMKDSTKPFLYNINIDVLYHRCDVFRAVKVYFLRRNINLNFYNIDSQIYSELLDIAPRYVDINSNWFYDNILNRCEYAFGTKNRKYWLKNKIIEAFKFKNKPPCWLQNPEWPINEKGPLLFIKQSDNPNYLTKDYIDYYFDDDGKEVVVRQFD